MQHAVTGADLLCRDLTQEGEDRCVTSVGGRQSRCRVQETRARHAGIDAGLARRLRKAKRHIGDALFMSGVDDSQSRARVVEGVEEGIELDSWKTKERRHAAFHENVDDRVCSRHWRRESMATRQSR